MSGGDPEALYRSARAGDWRALGRLLSLIEKGGPEARALGRLTFPSSAGVEMVVGVTGAPGSGKSTLTDRLIGEARASSRSVGVLAVDPSSPKGGGALLGDRVRMSRYAADPEVFIRSLASRGHLGGLALAAPEMVRALAAVGLAVVLVETVGVGQAEIEVSGAADTTVVVVNPGWGDDVQAQKAGLLEIADIFVVNKADRAGAESTRADLEAMLDLGREVGAGSGPTAAGDPGAGSGPAGGHGIGKAGPAGGSAGGLAGGPAGWWRPPVLLTSASTGAGVDQLWASIEAHHRHLVESRRLRERRHQQVVAEMRRVLARRLERDVEDLLGGPEGRQALARLGDRTLDPYDAAERLLASLRPRPDPH
jgi:GTPase